MKLRNIGLPLGFFFFLLAIWQFISMQEIIAFWIVPSPAAVLNVFVSSPQLIWHHLKPTMLAAVSGLVLSIILGSITAIAMNSSKFIKQIIYPYMVISQTVPIIAIAPLLIIWFGYGISSKIFAVLLMCFFPIALGLYDGFRNVSVEQICLLASMGASPYKIFVLLKIPSALPNFFTGLKLAATYSVMGAVIGEWLGGSSGLGIYMTRATKSYQTAHVFAVIVVIILLSMLLFGIVALLDRILLKWKYQHEDEYLETG
ncbi:MAG: ABC transporter permease [Candidatus Cloacimonetes bacterium HGW-Cloacimonetes-3]|nr:MAG: ABC transporter permease [Candidatus Cloacimonetes bacterium HGW-Cloacimonetes-3]